MKKPCNSKKKYIERKKKPTFEKKERVCIIKNKTKDACIITNFLSHKFFLGIRTIYI